VIAGWTGNEAVLNNLHTYELGTVTDVAELQSLRYEKKLN
jgi:hypothetical protein